MNTIVFVEDDAEVGSLIAAYLAKHDMQVTVEPRGDQAEETILRESPDLVLLDIMLPGKDGMTICRDLRAKWSGPIVLLTSLDSDMNHILALEMGACDYILKTTPPAVLLARLRLHLRQNEQATLTKGLQETSLTPYKALHFGTLTIDPINRVVTLANTEISLSTADFELLWELATHAGQIMDRDALLKNLRGVRLDRPQNELHLSEPDLPLWLSTHLADIQAVTPDKTVRIKTLAQGHYAALDMRLMERVLDNLLNNALRYCHSTVETSLLLSGNRATLIVEDDGPGIAPENREHIFEPFVRLDPSRDRSTGGCGLGLAIVHSIALAMGGTVNCDTSELGGARFSFSWPLWHNIPQFTSA